MFQFAGETQELGKFKIMFPAVNKGNKTIFHALKTKTEGLHRIKEAAFRNMQGTQTGTKEHKKILYFLKESTIPAELVHSKSEVVFHQVRVFLMLCFYWYPFKNIHCM